MTSNTNKPRGRPRGNKNGKIQQSILDSAEQLFADKGYAAVSVKEIGDSVGVNPAMIHYYFGSKKNLLQHVLERTLEPLAQTINEMKSASAAPVSGIIKLLLRAFSQHPNLPILVAREVLLPGGVMQQHFLSFLAPRLGGAVPALLANEQAEGRLREDIDPSISALTLMSLCAFPFFARSLAQPVLNMTYDEQGLETLERHINLLVQEGYAP